MSGDQQMVIIKLRSLYVTFSHSRSVSYSPHHELDIFDPCGMFYCIICSRPYGFPKDLINYDGVYPADLI